MIIEYDDGPCGSFKTTRCVTEMAAVMGRYVYAVDRREVMQERYDRIVARAAEAGSTPIVKIVRSRSDRQDIGGVTSVTQEIARIPRALDRAEHLIVIVTHEALKSMDWTAYDGFRLIVDEVPTVWYHEERETPACVEHFRAIYELERSPGGFSKVAVKSDCERVTLRDYQNDEVMRTFAVFHRRAASEHGVRVDLLDWDEMGLPGRKWSWFSIFNIMELAPFSSIWVVGNAFTESLFYRLIANRAENPENPEFGIHFRPLPGNSLSKDWEPRKVTVRYFTENHRAGSSLWAADTSPFKDAQHKWADWIARNSDPANHYWSANMRHIGAWTSGSEETPTLPGIAISPKCSGDNHLREITVASVCYSAKGKPAEVNAYKMFGINGDMIRRAREYEDLIQIAFRSSLRVADDPRDVEVRVYDLGQAEFLRDYLATAGFPFDVELVYTHIGLDDIQRKTMKDHHLDKVLAKCLTEDERLEAIARSRMTKAEKVAARRAKERAERIAAGEIIRPRGRPRKAA